MDPSLLTALLAAIPCPAFYLRGGSAAACNPAAEALGVFSGMSAEQLLDPIPEAPAGEPVRVRAKLLGTACTLRCSRTDEDGIILVLEARERDALPPAVRELRDAEQELSTAIDLAAEGSDTARHTALACRSLFRLERITLRLEWYYRLTGDGFRPDRQATDLSEWIRTLCQQADDLLRCRGQRLELRSSAPEHWIGSIDRNLAGMMFWELTARFAAMADGADLRLSVSRTAQGGLRLAVSIPRHRGELPGQAEALRRADSEDPAAWPEGSFDLGPVSMAAKQHGGSLLLTSDAEGAVCAVLSLDVGNLPSDTLCAPSVRLERGLHPGLVMLSDLLPVETFDPQELDF